MNRKEASTCICFCKWGIHQYNDGPIAESDRTEVPQRSHIKHNNPWGQKRHALRYATLI
jgi:hypothetical protein